MPLALKYFLLLLFTIHFVPLFYFLSVALVGRCCGIPVKRLGILFKPVLAKFRVAGIPVEIGCLPFGIELALDDQVFVTRPLWMRWLVNFSGIAGYFLLALIFLPLPVLLREIGEGFGQWWQGLISPMGEAQRLIESGLTRADRPFREFFPFVMAKSLAVNLLFYPYYMLNATFVTGRPYEKLHPAVRFLIMPVAMIIMMAAFVWYLPSRFTSGTRCSLA